MSALFATTTSGIGTYNIPVASDINSYSLFSSVVHYFINWTSALHSYFLPFCSSIEYNVSNVLFFDTSFYKISGVSL